MKIVSLIGAGALGLAAMSAGPAEAQRYGWNDYRDGRGWHDGRDRRWRGDRYHRADRWDRGRRGWDRGYYGRPRVVCRIVRGYYGPERRCFRR